MIEQFTQSDLGENVKHLYALTSKIKNGIIVDCGIRHGVSTQIMLIDSEKNKNTVYGIEVDPQFSNLDESIKTNPQFKFILGESSTVGKNWDKSIDGLFIDTVHVKEQVMIELLYWYPHIKEGGFIGFHDTGWVGDHHDTHGNVIWDRVDDGLRAFFGIDNLNYEDAFIKSSHYPESWGMTFIEIKKKKDYVSKIHWEEIFKARNYLIGWQWKDKDMKDCLIEYNMPCK
jgi:predicted O-methyltransferase YrrM